MVFCVLEAYKQLYVSNDCQELLPINTHQGIFACSRLIDGAPAIFQSVMDRILLGIEGVRLLHRRYSTYMKYWLG